jgi:hypothetical protein
MLNDNGWAITSADGKTPMYAFYDLEPNDTTRYLQYYFHEGILRGWREKELIYLSRPGIRDVHKLQHALRENGVQTELIIKNKATNNE